MKALHLTYDQIDTIVIEELQEAYQMNLVANKDEGGGEIPVDMRLLCALELVLRYYMTGSQTKEWEASVTKALQNRA
ncbi:MAG TPA: hypothetical protein VFM18_12455 [Methanosarcina sp.]|nr:hypothetical protein [Methanosarcina sp.]